MKMIYAIIAIGVGMLAFLTTVACAMVNNKLNRATQIRYVAGVLTAEAGGELYAGKVMVATVIHNRMRFTGKTAYEVVTETRQFAKPKLKVKEGVPELVLAEALVDEKFKTTAIRGKTATHFYAHKKCAPWWADCLTDKVTVGNHTFGRLSDGRYSK